MEFLDRSTSLGLNPLYILEMIFNHILFDSFQKPEFKKSVFKKDQLAYAKVKHAFMNEVSKFEVNNDIGIDNSRILKSITDFLELDSSSLKVCLIYFVNINPKLLTITDFILLKNQLNIDLVHPYSFNDLFDFLNNRSKDYRLKMYLYFYFIDIYDVNLKKGYISNAEYEKSIEYFRTKYKNY